MFKSTLFFRSDPGLKTWAPSLMVLSAIIPIIAMVFLGKQPKEVTATIYSAYLGILALPIAVVSKKKGRRSLAIIAFAMCIMFTGLFVIYAYLAFNR